VGPENIDTPITEVHWKFRRGGGSQKPKSLKEGTSLNWNFQRGKGVETQKTPCGGEYRYFLEQHNTVRKGNLTS